MMASAETFYSSPAAMLQAESTYITALGQYAVAMANAAAIEAKTDADRLKNRFYADMARQANLEIARFNFNRHTLDVRIAEYERWQQLVTALQVGSDASESDRQAAWLAYDALVRKLGIAEFDAWYTVPIGPAETDPVNFLWTAGHTHTWDPESQSFVDLYYAPEPCPARNLAEFMAWYHGEPQGHGIARRYRMVVRSGSPASRLLLRVVHDLAHVYDAQIAALNQATAQIQAGTYQYVPLTQLLGNKVA